MVKSVSRNSPPKIRLYPRVLKPHRAERRVQNQRAVHVLLQLRSLPRRCASSQVVLAVVVKTRTSHLAGGVPDFALVRETLKKQLPVQENALVRNQGVLAVLYRRLKTPTSHSDRPSVPDFAPVRETLKKQLQENALVRNQGVLTVLYRRLKTPTLHSDRTSVPDFALVRETTKKQRQGNALVLQLRLPSHLAPSLRQPPPKHLELHPPPQRRQL